MNSLRIVTNGKEYCIQQQTIYDDEPYCQYFLHDAFSLWDIVRGKHYSYLVGPTKIWSFIDNHGFKIPPHCKERALRFKTKKEALNWIEKQWGQTGLNALENPPEEWKHC